MDEQETTPATRRLRLVCSECLAQFDTVEAAYAHQEENPGDEDGNDVHGGFDIYGPED